jgi:hypothetical protein
MHVLTLNYLKVFMYNNRGTKCTYFVIVYIKIKYFSETLHVCAFFYLMYCEKLTNPYSLILFSIPKKTLNIC